MKVSQRFRLRGFALLSTLFLLSACYAARQPQPDDAEALPVIRHYLSHCMALNDPCVSAVSFPFYVDGQTLSVAEYTAEMPSGRNPNRQVPDFEIGYRLLPISDVQVFWPEFWERFQNSSSFTEDGPRLALAPFYARFNENTYEKGWLILRRVKNRWQVAGLIDG